jgi:hypothetical protein
MKRFSEQFHKQAKNVTLSVAEKAELQERLVAYMEYHPLPDNKKQANKITEIIPSTFTFEMIMGRLQAFFSTSNRPICYALGSFALILLVTIPVLSERAMPGDVLYAIKVQVNEELRSTLIFDSYQKVEWETKRLNRRIAEARLLASEGKLTEAAEAVVAKAVQEHTATAQKQIEVLRTVDADEATIASIALDTTLETQSVALRREPEKDSIYGNIKTNQTNILADMIDATRVRPEMMSTSSLPAYIKLMARIEQNTTRIYELRHGLQDITETEKLTEIDRRIADIERMIESATKFSVGGEQESRSQLVDVLQRTQRLIFFLTEVDVSKTVDIEKLVPVVLTDEEENIVRQEAVDTIDRSISMIEDGLKDVKDTQVTEKVIFGLNELANFRKEIASTSVKYVVFRTIINDANALIADTVSLLEQQGVVLILRDLSDTASTSTSTSDQISIEEQPNASSTLPVSLEEVGDITDDIID